MLTDGSVSSLHSGSSAFNGPASHLDDPLHDREFNTTHGRDAPGKINTKRTWDLSAAGLRGRIPGALSPNLTLGRNRLQFGVNVSRPSADKQAGSGAAPSSESHASMMGRLIGAVGGDAVYRRLIAPLLPWIPEWCNLETNLTLLDFDASQKGYSGFKYGPTRGTFHNHASRITINVDNLSLGANTSVAQKCLPSVSADLATKAAASTGHLWTASALGMASTAISGILLAAQLLPIRLQLFVSINKEADLFDLAALYPEMPIIKAAVKGDSRLGIPDEPAQRATKLWVDERMTKHEFGLQVLPKKRMLACLPALATCYDTAVATLQRFIWREPAPDAVENGAAANSLWDPSANLSRIALQRTIRYTAPTPRQHQQLLQHNAASTGLVDIWTFIAWLKKFIDDNILCINRFDADGKILAWHKRFYARHWIGHRSEEKFSPHNIPYLAPGEKLIYRDRIENNFIPRIFAALFPSENRLTDLIRNLFPGIIVSSGCATETGSEYMGFDEDGQDIIRVQTSTSLTESKECNLSINPLSRSLSLGATKKKARIQTLVVHTDIPTQSRDSAGNLIANPKLDEIRYNFKDAVGLPKLSPQVAITQEMAKRYLADIVHRNEQGFANAFTQGFDRWDRSLEVVTEERFSESRRTLTFGLAPNGSGRLADALVSVVRNERIIAEATPHGIKTNSVLSTVCSTRTLSRLHDEDVTVFASLKNDDGQEGVVDSIRIGLTFILASGHREQDAQAALRKYGNTFLEGRPFDTVLGLEEGRTKTGLEPLSRIIRLEANLLHDRLTALAKACSHSKAQLVRQACAHRISEDSILELIRHFAMQEQSTFGRGHVEALGTFVCEMLQPERAIQFLAEVCGGKFFQVAPKSCTATAGLLAQETTDFCNTVALGCRSFEEPWAWLISQLAHLQSLRNKCRAARQELSDPYVCPESRASHEGTLQEAERKLTQVKVDCLQAMGPSTKSLLTEHLLRSGIYTQEDALAAIAIEHQTFLRSEIDALSRNNTCYLTPQQSRRLNNNVAIMTRDLSAILQGGSQEARAAWETSQAA